ncbi:hypothetical protein Cni_G00622 [Canna indica]|uniref:EF-hand domain-containing protein n=1 Tax=Canna indica TaxID=4628 RepID=A0AAQ3JN28_9LILI|nr:hypothetical protein Cni_G00622 [Canna indica]
MKSLLSAAFLLLIFATGSKAQEQTPLQKHVAFFDANNDGIVYPTETYKGLRAIGLNAALSLAASALINGFMSPKTTPDGKFNPLLPIYVSNINKAMHGGDTGVYDSNGGFVEANFEAIFEKHAKTNPNALTKQELDEMLQANKDSDVAGGNASSAEWNVLYNLCKDKDGFLQKETIRKVIDGSLFYELQKANQSSLKQ